MAYRSFKSVLGETSLERKCRLLFGTCLLLLITGSFWWYGEQTNELVYNGNRLLGRLIVDTALMAIHWEEMETSEEYKRARAVPALVQKLRITKDYSWHVIKPSVDAINPARSSLERELLELWTDKGTVKSDGQEPIDFRERRYPEEYHYYQPVYVKPECVLCHRIHSNRPELSEGELMAIIQVKKSVEETVAAQNWNRATLLATAIITVFLAMVALYVIVRYVIVKPLTHLRDVSDEIGRGNTQLRAEIKTGDEFQELGESFNRMLRHMLDAQEELKGLNRNLDNKVDELAQVNMKLYETNRLKTDFLATVSHELRTPLNSILGFSDVLSTIESLDDKQKRYVTNIQRSGRMLLEMINDILDLAKIESGRMEVRLSEFNIDSVISAQCDMARPLTENKNIDLDFGIQGGLPVLIQDQGKVQQILSNLLSNAIKFTPEGGLITVHAQRDAIGNLELVVADTGVGIADEDQVAVFEKFRQGTSYLAGGDAMTREYSGTGLGLSIVKELCRLLGGEVSLESELGKGSTFTVRLPWTRTEQPKLESSLADDLDELTKPRTTDYPPQANTTVSTSTPSS